MVLLYNSLVTDISTDFPTVAYLPIFMACVNTRRLLKGLRLRSLGGCAAEWLGSCIGRLP